MKILVFFISFFLITINSTIAQEKKKLSRKEKKELKKQQQIEQKKAILDLLHSETWVIEAHTVFDRYNQSYQLNPTINFVGIDGKEGALQLGFDGLIGWNGVGGVTLDGKVTKYEVKEGKSNSSPTVSLRFQGRVVGSASINVTVNSSGQATARVSGDFGDRITFTGMIKSLEESSVYKGQSLF
ncbi:MAG: DUF4251 domain-containing protein [Cyclobacteriaceae bacterium]|nr:DUF4251 domain-containing protein [Cyclobacteriaceae bacterium]